MPSGDTVVPVAGALVLVMGLVGALPAPAVLVVVGLAGIGYALTITRWMRSASPHRGRGHRGRRRGDTGRGSRRGRGVGFLATGMLFSGASTAAAGAAEAVAPQAMLTDVRLAAELPNVGLFFTVGTYLLGLLLMPGVEATFVGRVRRMLDGVGIGIWAFFVAWLLLFAGVGLRGAALTAVVLGSVAVSTSVVGTMRAVQYHPAAFACGAGVVTSIAGVTGLVVALDYRAGSAWLIAVAAALFAGPVWTWRGLRATARVAEPPVRVDGAGDGDGSFAGYPLLVLPLAGALVAAGYHFVQHRGFDSMSIVLGLAGVVVLAARETLAVTDVRRYARRLAAREEHFRSLVVGSTDVTVMLDAKLVVRWQSPAAARQFGLSDQDVVGRPFLGRVHPQDAGRIADDLAALTGPDAGHLALVEARLLDGFGEWRDTEWSISDQRSVRAVGALVVHVRDVSERKKLERAMDRASFTDQLTGLPNRRELRRAQAVGTEIGALIVLGIGGVTGVNQLRGHEVGDAAIVEAARRLVVGVSGSGMIARLGGDEFAVLTEGGAVPAQLLATRLLTLLTEPYQISGVAVYLHASAGLAELVPGADGDEALRRAELALQRARRRGSGGAAVWYDEAVEAVQRRRLSIEQDLPGVTSRGELDLTYQPIVELPERHPVGIEARLCWRHPTLGTVTDTELLGIAEELGLVDEIGDWVLHRACRELSGWLRDGRDLWLSINVPVAQLAGVAFVGAVTAALDAHLLPTSQLVVEVAEVGLGTRNGVVDPAADNRAHAVAVHLAELRMLGVRVALDQFGAQSTSLSQLRLLPLDLLKLDRQLFSNSAGRVGRATAIVEAVVNLANQVGVEVAVLGLETEVDVDEAVNAGCRFGQGDVLCRPVPPERLEAYLGHLPPLDAVGPAPVSVIGQLPVLTIRPGSLLERRYGRNSRGNGDGSEGNDRRVQRPTESERRAGRRGGSRVPGPTRAGPVAGTGRAGSAAGADAGLPRTDRRTDRRTTAGAARPLPGGRRRPVRPRPGAPGTRRACRGPVAQP